MCSQGQCIRDQKVIIRCAIVIGIPFILEVRKTIVVLIFEATPLGCVPQWVF